MEPLDTDDIEYVSHAPTPSNPASRLSVLYIFPLLGFLLVLLFIVSAIFQLNLSGFVDNLVVLMVVLFFLFIGLLFWGLSPRRGETKG